MAAYLQKPLFMTDFDVHSLKGIRILIIDDSDMMIQFLQLILEKKGAIVIAKEDAFDGIDFFHSKTADCDIVLMDMQLPSMDGHTAAREIRKFRSYLPIIAISADDSIDSFFDGHVQKPVEANSLYAEILRILKQRQQ